MEIYRIKIPRVPNEGGCDLCVQFRLEPVPYQQGRVGNAPQKVTESVYHKGELGNVPEGGGRYFEQDPEGGTTSVALKDDTTKSGYLILYPGGLYKINWKPLDKKSESNKALIGEPNKSTKSILEMTQYN